MSVKSTLKYKTKSMNHLIIWHEIKDSLTKLTEKHFLTLEILYSYTLSNDYICHNKFFTFLLYFLNSLIYSIDHYHSKILNS